MNKRSVDVAVIGAGSAGLAADRAARKWTRKVVLIEGGKYGTTCARVGCIPSKLLIAAAEAAHAVREAPAFGVRTEETRIDGKAVMVRVRNERDRFVGFVLESVDDIPAEHRLRGMARFLDDYHLQVGDDLVVQARRIVTGEVSFENQGRSRVMLKNKGLLRVYAEARTGRFLGAEMVGPRAEHVGHLLAWAHQSRLTVSDMLAMPFYHPVIEEGLRTALRDARSRLSAKQERAA